MDTGKMAFKIVTEIKFNVVEMNFGGTQKEFFITNCWGLDKL